MERRVKSMNFGHLARPMTKCVDFIDRCRAQSQPNFISGPKKKKTQPLKWPPRCPLNEKFLRPMNEKSVTFQTTVCRLVPADASADTGEAQLIPSASPRRIFRTFFFFPPSKDVKRAAQLSKLLRAFRPILFQSRALNSVGSVFIEGST